MEHTQDELLSPNSELQRELANKVIELERTQRELQIEAALEKVRSRSIAMHNSTELHDVIKVVTEQLLMLGMHFEYALFCKVDDAGNWDLYVSTPQQAYPAKIHFAYFDNTVFNRFNEQAKTGIDFFTDLSTAEEKNIFFRRFFEITEARNIPDERKKYVLNDRGMARSFFRLKNIWFAMGKYDEQPFADEENSVFKRFANVFDQSYTRFLDLQKAEANAKEAQIEAALEKVRSRSLAMHKSDELKDVISLLFEKLRELNVAMDATTILTFSDDTRGYTVWAANPDLFSVASVYTPYFDDPISNEIYTVKKDGNDFIDQHWTAEQSKACWQYLFEHSDWKRTPDHVQQTVLHLEGWGFTGPVFKNSATLLVSYSQKEYKEHEKEIVKRFGKVFEQAYIRFLDLQKAEAQAREAQIELGLERVRARAMAMYNSEELNEIAGTMFNELTKLDFTLVRCVIILIDGDTGSCRWFMANPEDLLHPANFFIKYHEQPGYLAVLKAFRERIPKWVYVNEGQLKKEWSDFLFSETELSSLPDPVKEGMKVNERVFMNFSFGNFGGLLLSTVDPLPDEKSDILLRFAKVFEQTYTRFLDLQKAEAQAREAQIEAALEKIRSRSLAMHKSNELKDVIAVVFEKLKELGLVFDASGIYLFQAGSKDSVLWVANPYVISEPSLINLPYDEELLGNSEIFNSMWKARQTGEHIYNRSYSFDEKNKYFSYVGKHNRQMPTPVVEMMLKMPGYTHSVIIGKNSALMADSWTGNNFSVEECNVLNRLAKVFEQAYTRFLDLKQAEAQAREAQIQLALERVRARTMAMHRSEELAETALLLYEQLIDLGVVPVRSMIGIVNEQEDVIEWWMTKPGGKQIEHEVSTKITDHRALGKMFECWKEQKKATIIDFSEIELSDWLNYVRKEMRIAVSEESSRGRAMDTIVASFKYGFIAFVVPAPNSNETMSVIERFAGVFNLTYGRFLDLQKAETQTRESQIQLALERVRARTMAMQHSEELAETTGHLFVQLNELGIKPYRCSIAIVDQQQETCTFWSTTNTGDVIRASSLVPLTEMPALIGMYDAWKNKLPRYKFIIEGKDRVAWAKYVSQYTQFKEYQPAHINTDQLAHEPAVFNCFMFKQGFLHVHTREEITEADATVIQRFANVFEQTYTRFLDLQKAEANAREAQIEAALEKVRSSAMAMHNSNDISDTTSVVFTELKKIGIYSIRCGVGLLTKDSMMADVYAAAITANGEFHTLRRTIDMAEHPTLSQQYKSWLNQENYATMLSGEELRSYYALPFFQSSPSYVATGQYDRKEYGYYIPFAEGLFYAWTENPYSKTEENILNRFKTNIALTFRRFLDLQKAEANAREAQIEAALEKVRSSTMAMHKSEDLAKTASVMFEQLSVLGNTPDRISIGIINEPAGFAEMWLTDQAGGEISLCYCASLNEKTTIRKLVGAWKAGAKSTLIDLTGQELKEWLKYVRQIGLKIKDEYFKNRRIHNVAFFSHGWLNISTLEPLPSEMMNIVERFAAVYSLTYRRFIDLQKAEAQAREAQIEASLERVRSKTMAMHNSNDVGETVAAMFAEFMHLDISTNRCGILIFNDENSAEVWTARSTPEGQAKLIIGKLDLNAHDLLRSAYNTWKAKGSFHQYDLAGDDLKQYYQAINNLKYYPVQFDLNALPSKEFHSDFFFTDGALFSFTNEPVLKEHAKIIKRFASVFGQTYRRYLDLKKAEAQAREAQIEASLERVRSKTMAMHSSQDVADTVAAMFDELTRLNVQTIRCGIGIMHEPNELEVWTARPARNGKADLVVGRLDTSLHPLLEEGLDGWKNKKKHFSYELKGNDLKTYFSAINNYPGYPIKYDIGALPPKIIHNDFYFAEGTLFAFSTQHLSHEAAQILKRFASVFGQTYRRYLDLQKAEAQAREAQIEAALERVRAKAMAMHSSDDLVETIRVYYQQLGQLNLMPRRCGVGLIDKDARSSELIGMVINEEGQSKEVAGQLSLTKHPVLENVYQNWLSQTEYHAVLRGNEIKDYYKLIGAQIPIDNYPEDAVQYGYFFSFTEGQVYAWTEKQFSEEELKIYRRFTSVLSLTYKRYKDLKLAEAQAREATIEAALEKVRGKAMAMHNSNDLSATASMVFTELRKLGISPIRCGVGLLTRESFKAQLYSATSTAEGDSLALFGWVMLSGHPVLENIYHAWTTHEDYFPELTGEQLGSYYEHLLAGLSLPSVPNWNDGETEYGHFFSFSIGCLYAWSDTRYNDAEIKILKRFATIVDLTFRRYLELQTSEANAREAVKQAALDRIRADIASMRTKSDLDRITPLIWNELTILGLPFIRCGVFIMDDLQQTIHTFLSTPDGKAIAAFHMPYDTPGKIQHVIAHWLKNTSYVDHWEEANFAGLADLLVNQGAFSSAEQYFRTLPKGGFYLHFLPFLQGMLYVGNTTRLSEEHLALIQSVADAFSTAYARYEDFNRLEAAKQQVEKTLVDLKQAQQQLVQSEKMASLGELTAGIAHEIQNPLNFVNNFSEVSNELIEEMKQDLEAGNLQLATSVADDIKQNLEKILHHGQRADAIVKGMLQHSRISSGQKELTDINVLADEYLRLAYHGLRAKDKSFNAKFETDFDNSIGKISIIPQDLGRVILNLINNGFYAATQKKKQNIPGYEPTIIIRTKKIEDKVLISIQDNGPGISPNIVDKIFQPFFTTKPTGQGTGLGLSLSYDIVKAHGGDIRVVSRDGEGSEFIIELPISPL